MKKILRIFFLKNGLKVKVIYRINGEIKIEIFKKEVYYYDIFLNFKKY